MQNLPERKTMDWLTFISTMATALAWPIAIVALAAHFRSEIRSLIAGMKKLKVGPMEAEMFELQVREAKSAALALPNRVTDMGPAQYSTPGSNATLPNLAAKGGDIDSYLLDLVTSPAYRTAPRTGVLAVWNAVEDAVRSLAERSKADPKATVSVMLHELQRLGALSKEEFELLRKLSALRDEAYMSTGSITEDAALDYVAAASTILRKTGLSDKPGRSVNIRSVPLGVSIG